MQGARTSLCLTADMQSRLGQPLHGECDHSQSKTHHVNRERDSGGCSFTKSVLMREATHWPASVDTFIQECSLRSVRRSALAECFSSFPVGLVLDYPVPFGFVCLLFGLKTCKFA